MSDSTHQPYDRKAHYDKVMREIELIDPTDLYLVVPGSQLQQQIKNLATGSVDEELKRQ